MHNLLTSRFPENHFAWKTASAKAKREVTQKWIILKINFETEYLYGNRDSKSQKAWDYRVYPMGSGAHYNVSTVDYNVSTVDYNVNTVDYNVSTVNDAREWLTGRGQLRNPRGNRRPRESSFKTTAVGNWAFDCQKPPLCVIFGQTTPRKLPIWLQWTSEA